MTIENPPEQPRRIGSGGRRLDRSRDAAILQAALEGLAELGYDRLSMDEIAARAHAGKGALYRRWRSKAALIVDAVVAWRDARAPVEIPDTGSLTGDIDAMIAAVPDFDDAARQQLAALVGLITAAGRDPELRQALAAGLLERPRRLIREVLQRAVTRGEIPAERDLELIPDIVIGLNLMRILQGELPDREHARRVLQTMIYPLVTAPPNP
jgi:AcrR family transcriptional regulator